MAVHLERLGPTAVRAWAPGRVTFVGDHTDYNFGLSLATSLPRGTWSRTSLADTDRALSIDGRGPQGWEVYVEACLRLVRDSGAEVPPMQIEISGDLPIGKGLSSSASLISATLASIHGLIGHDCSADDLAVEAQRVENDYLAIPTGTLDQEVIVRSRDDALVLVDFGRETVEGSVLPHLDGHRFLVIDPGLPRRLDRANFGIRRAECADGLTTLTGASDREAWLRFRATDWSEIRSAASSRSVPPRQLRRLVHVWSENQRVLEMPEALAAGDIPVIADLINRSHESLRDDFAVSTAEIEKARTRLLEQPGIEAARLVGAGFGGCLLALAVEGAQPAEVPYFELVDAHAGPERA